jgi:hypothetical protein
MKSLLEVHFPSLFRTPPDAKMPEWAPPGAERDPRAYCKNDIPFSCPEGTGALAGHFFLPEANWDPCVTQCIIRHEVKHLNTGLLAGEHAVVRQECPSLLEELRCLLEFMMQWQSQCCDTFRQYQPEIRAARGRLSLFSLICDYYELRESLTRLV